MAEDVDVTGRMPAVRFRQAGALPLLDDASLWDRSPEIGELYNEPPLGQWYLIMDTAREWPPLESIQAGERIQALREDIKTEVAQAGVDLLAISKGETPMPDKLAELFTRLHEEAARAAIGNIRLMQTALEQVDGSVNFTEDTKLAMFEHGFDGLLRAAKKYNPWHGREASTGNYDDAYRFSTYAVPWMVGMMKNALKKMSGDMSISQTGNEDMSWYRKATAYLNQIRDIPVSHDLIVATILFRRANGRLPEGNEVKKLVSEPARYRQGGEVVDRRFYEKAKRFGQMVSAQSVRSIDAAHEVQTHKPVEDDHPGTFIAQLGDLIVSGDDPVAAVDKTMMEQTLYQVMEDAQLRPKERQVLNLRFGLGDGQKNTLEETARKMGVGRERIRQIEAQALSRLRHPRFRRMLRDYLMD